MEPDRPKLPRRCCGWVMNRRKSQCISNNSLWGLPPVAAGDVQSVSMGAAGRCLLVARRVVTAVVAFVAAEIYIFRLASHFLWMNL